MPEGVLIFLDFDGVLRRKDAPRYRFEKPLRVAFEEAVRRIPGAEIVVTSSWREVAGLSALRRLFSLDVAARIVGVVPIGRFLEDFPRYGEVLAYLEKNGAEGREWVAVDDDSLAYPAGCSVVLVDPATGFGADEAKRLLEMAGRTGSGFSAV